MDILNFLQEMLQNSWGWILGIGFLALIVVVFIIQVVKAVIVKVLAFLLIPVAGLTGGVVDTAHEYWEDAQDKGVSVVKYISDYVER